MLRPAVAALGLLLPFAPAYAQKESSFPVQPSAAAALTDTILTISPACAAKNCQTSVGQILAALNNANVVTNPSANDYIVLAPSGNTPRIAPLSSIVPTLSQNTLIATNNLSDISNASAARNNLGLGTMAMQNPASVSISGGVIAGVAYTGGTVDGAAVGANTPSSGVFTGLATAGLGTIIAGDATTNQVSLRPQATGTSPQIAAQGVDTNADLVLIAKGTGVIRNGGGSAVSLTAGTINGTSVGATTPSTGQFSSLTTSGVGTLVVGSSANNQISIQPKASGSSPVIVAQGVDANLDIQLIPKGTGVIRTYPQSVLRAYHLSERADINGGTAWAGTNSGEGVSNFFSAGGVSGTAGAGDASVNYFTIPSDTLDCTAAAGGLCSGIELAHNFGGSGAKGSRTGIGVLLNLTAATGGIGGSYVAGQFTAQANVNDGGGAGTERSSVFGVNGVAALTSAAATHFSQVVGAEFDAYAVTGSSMKDKIGLQIVQVVHDAVSGSRDDVGFSINNQAGTPGWGVGFEFGRAGGTFPVPSTGTLVYAQGLGGIGWTVVNGIDLHLGTFTGNSWNDGHIQMTGAGDFLANSATALATTATAGFLHLPHTTAAPTGTPTNTTPGCEWNTTSHTLNCYDGAAWYHIAGTSGAA